MSTSLPWVAGRTIPEVLAQTAARFGERDAVVFPRLGLRWSYGDFQHKVEIVARALLGSGIKPGEHVGVWSTNWPEWILLQFGVARMGGVLVNVNPAYRAHELAYVLEQADIVALALTDTFKSSHYETILSSLVPELAQARAGMDLSSNRLPKLRRVISIKDSPSLPGVQRWSDFLGAAHGIARADLDEITRTLLPEQPANIQYTSGTTGDPKGAMLSHRNLLFNAHYVGERMRITERDRLCIPVPFYHCFGCVMGTMMCATRGAAMVVPAESFDPEATLEAVAAERCTALYGVPTMFSAELHHPRFERFDLSSLRTGIMAGSPCPIELMRQVTSRMGLEEMTIAYGLTEASPVITQTETSEPLEIRVTTVGKPLPGLEVRLVDPESGHEAAPGAAGELWVRGHGVMLGYYKKPEATAAAIDEAGWLRTGDLAAQTPTGHFRITGRIKDMIIRGGENIYPREIEEFLLTHPKIREAQVVGLPDSRFGEQVSAWIIPKEPGTLTADEVRDFCAANIAHYKVPCYVEIVGEYPLTVTGKVKKFELRAMGIERHRLHAASRMETA